MKWQAMGTACKKSTLLGLIKIGNKRSKKKFIVVEMEYCKNANGWGSTLTHSDIQPVAWMLLPELPEE